MYSNSIFSIDRCQLPNDSNLIFNKEGFTYNQIKVDEYKLYDRTGCPWIVGYLQNNRDTALTHTISTASNYDVNMSSTAYASWSYHSLVNTMLTGPKTLTDTRLGIS